jgi:hypothetical protein
LEVLKDTTDALIEHIERIKVAQAGEGKASDRKK